MTKTEGNWLDATLKEGGKRRRRRSLRSASIAATTRWRRRPPKAPRSPSSRALARSTCSSAHVLGGKAVSLSRRPLQQPLMGSVARCGTLTVSVITVRSEPAQATRIPPSYWCISRVQNKNTNTLSKTVSDKQPSAPVKRSQSHRKTHMTCTARRVEMCNGGRPS